ncbi:MAG: hypothetical protein ABIV48_00540 [Pyrinomonadaceae bacterium]
MQITTVEGIVKNGQILLGEEVVLPEMTKVFVIIPNNDNLRRIISPRLVNKADAKIFEKRVEVELDDEI